MHCRLTDVLKLLMSWCVIIFLQARKKRQHLCCWLAAEWIWEEPHATSSIKQFTCKIDGCILLEATVLRMKLYCRYSEKARDNIREYFLFSRCKSSKESGKQHQVGKELAKYSLDFPSKNVLHKCCTQISQEPLITRAASIFLHLVFQYYKRWCAVSGGPQGDIIAIVSFLPP